MPDQINEPTTTRSKNRWALTGIIFSTLAVLILISAFSIGYFQLAKVNITLAQQVDQLQQQTARTQDSLSTLQASLADLHQSVDKVQATSAKQEQLMADWEAAQKGNLDKWHVAEAQNMVKLANDQLQFAHNTTAAFTLLQRADQTLESLNDPNLLDIRKSIATAIANLQATPVADTTKLYLQLAELQALIDQLPLPATPLNPDNQPLTATPTPSDSAWWQVGLNRTWQALRQLVVVRYNGSNTLPLVLPEEKVFLYQNLHAKLDNAMWAVLQGNNDVYQVSLKQVLAWIQQYFTQTAPATQTALQNIQALQKINIQPPATNLSDSLQLFDRYFQQTTSAVRSS